MNKMVIFLVGFILSVSLSFAEEQKAVPADTKVLLERTMCYGTCPVYKLTIYADGKVEFSGERFVNAIGSHVKTISQEKVALMLTEADSINFFKLNGKYDCYEQTDQPIVEITITKEGNTKKVVHDHGCLSTNKKELAALTKLEDKIDELAEITDWLGNEVTGGVWGSVELKVAPP